MMYNDVHVYIQKWLRYSEDLWTYLQISVVFLLQLHQYCAIQPYFWRLNWGHHVLPANLLSSYFSLTSSTGSVESIKQIVIFLHKSCFDPRCKGGGIHRQNCFNGTHGIFILPVLSDWGNWPLWKIRLPVVKLHSRHQVLKYYEILLAILKKEHKNVF